MSDEQPAAATTGTRQRRGANIVLWVLQVLLAIAFLVFGMGKLAGAEQASAVFDEIGAGDWLRYLIGALEIAAAIGLLIPLLAGLAAFGLVALMVGAIVTEIAIDGFVVLPLALLVIAGIIAWGRRDSVSRVAATVTRRA